MRTFLALSLCFLLGALSGAALAGTLVRTMDGATAYITHGEFLFQDPATGGDGGWTIGCCGKVTLSETGASIVLPNPCVSGVQVGAFSNASASCRTALRNANRLPDGGAF